MLSQTSMRPQEGAIACTLGWESQGAPVSSYPTVTIHPVEYARASVVSFLRQSHCLFVGSKDNHGFDGADGEGISVRGAVAEAVVAKLLGIPWIPTINTFQTGYDVARYQVRSTVGLNHNLILHDSDNNDQIFILVRGRGPTYEVPGWILCSEGKLWGEYRQLVPNRPKEHVVPAKLLHPFPLPW